MLNVVILNGGRGASAIIPALLDRQGLHVTSVVNAYDDGKSTGEIRKFFGMLGPSDIRKVQELMLPMDESDYASNLRVYQHRFLFDCDHDQILAELNAFGKGYTDALFNTKFSNKTVCIALQRFVRVFTSALVVIEKTRGEQFNFSDCSVMNCIFAGAFLAFNRNIEQATQFIDKLFKLRGTVLPTSIEDKKLVALRENGQMLYSEAEIVELRSNVRIERIYLLDKPLERSSFESLSVDEKRDYLEQHHCYVAASPGVQLALQQADMIIYAAGTQHSSLYPTYLSTGLAASIADNKDALKVFVTNIGADYETPAYKASDYIRGAYRYLNLSGSRSFNMQELFDIALINNSRAMEGDTYVEFDEGGFSGLPVRLVIDSFESASFPGKHNGQKVVKAILDFYDGAIELKMRA